MIAVGDEGMRTDGSTKEPHSWLNRGYEGVDFKCNLAAPSVSFGTIHAYVSFKEFTSINIFLQNTH
jgi:hypothetical protein